MKQTYSFVIVLFLCGEVFSQSLVLQNIYNRKTTSLNGIWQYLMDPYDTGYFNYHSERRSDKDWDAYWMPTERADKNDRVEYGFTPKYSIKVPGDWNHQDAKFLYYEGAVWYNRTFDYKKTNPKNELNIYFAGSNYYTSVFLNHIYLGEHKGGFSPFQFTIPDSLLKETKNQLTVRVDNKRFKEEIPTTNIDWWNYGGITRDVMLVETPYSAIFDYKIEYGKDQLVHLNLVISNPSENEKIIFSIPELKFKQSLIYKNGKDYSIKIPNLKLWTPENPKLYEIVISSNEDVVKDKVGFRTIETQGTKIVLNGKSQFLRGICIHEEIPMEQRRAIDKRDAVQLLTWAKELGCNMVRLAHYPHSEYMTRAADSLGLMVWSEIPVYWAIQFGSETVYLKAKNQLIDMYQRDKNRASVIIWSVGNETPQSPERLKFMSNLAKEAKKLDPSRLVSAALLVSQKAPNWDLHTVDDSLGNYIDIVSVNEYRGWYGGDPTHNRTSVWDIKFNKPFFVSETGAESLGGYNGDTLTRWTEDYQLWFYREQVAMMKRMPSQFVGLSPWLLADFRSPKRNNPLYQEGWNNKGLIDQKGRKKKAFFELQKYYLEKKAIK